MIPLSQSSEHPFLARLRKPPHRQVVFSVYDWASLGFSLGRIRKFLGIPPKVWEEWVSQEPLVMEAFQAGREIHSEEIRDFFPELSLHQRQVLYLLYRMGNLTTVSQILGTGAVRSHLRWLQDDVQYGQAYQVVDSLIKDRIVSEGVRRAVNGVERLRLYKGHPVMIDCSPEDPEAIPFRTRQGLVYRKPLKEREYSDALMSKLLDALMLSHLRRALFEERYGGSLLSEKSPPQISELTVLTADSCKRLAHEYVEAHQSKAQNS